jgi:hypothetical protein
VILSGAGEALRSYSQMRLTQPQVETHDFLRSSLSVRATKKVIFQQHAHRSVETERNTSEPLPFDSPATITRRLLHFNPAGLPFLSSLFLSRSLLNFVVGREKQHFQIPFPINKPHGARIHQKER